MIAFISGKLIEKTPAAAVLENSGIGFNINISLTGYEQLGEVGDSVTLYTHLHVREDQLKLYGFTSTEERFLFRLLLSVSGIGPKVALGILSGISVGDFKEAVLHQNITRLQSAPGVGRKTAERLALELKDKISDISTERLDGTTRITTSVADEAVLALISLGYKQVSAEEAVRKSLQNNETLSVEELVRVALRGM